MNEPDTVLAIWKARINAARAALGDMMEMPHLTPGASAAVLHFFDEVEQLAEESEDDDTLRNRLAALLKGVAAGLKGPPPPLTQWDWSDLPARAEQARARIAELEAVWQDPAKLHANLLKAGYPRESALHLAGATDYDAIAAKLKAIKEHASGFGCWWHLTVTQEDLGGTAIPDDATILHFMGSGASTSVTAREIRRMLDTIYGERGLDIATPEQEARQVERIAALAEQLHVIKVNAGPLHDWFGTLLVEYADANDGISMENKQVLMGKGDAAVTAGDLRALLAAISHVTRRKPRRTVAINDTLGNDPLDLAAP